MNLISATIYGFIQGISEFLPISSSGHLALLPHFLKIEDPGVLFDLSMHLGTALAVMVYFRKDLKLLIHQLIQLLKGRSKGQEFAFNTMISTIASIALILVIKDQAGSFGRHPNIIAFNLFIFGLLMYIADRKGSLENRYAMENSHQALRAVWIGVFQALAVFPGVSRSGATLTIGRFLGLGREEATRYSFLLSLPLIVGGMLYKLKDFSSGEVTFDLLPCLWGMFVSFVVGLLTIHYFLKVIKKLGLLIFAIYRIILSGLIYLIIN